jgi:hypothetical protein
LNSDANPITNSVISPDPPPLQTQEETNNHEDKIAVVSFRADKKFKSS